MSERDEPLPIPAGWLEALQRGEADAAAGRTVPVETALEDLRDSLRRMELTRARRASNAA